MMTIEEILEMDKKELIQIIEKIATHKRKMWWYIHQEDELPCLVAHIDRIHEGRKTILTDKNKNIS